MNVGVLVVFCDDGEEIGGEEDNKHETVRVHLEGIRGGIFSSTCHPLANP